jgi:hypothetical protein
MKYFSPAEDHALCRAYVKITTDPQLGTGQKATQFWGNVKTVFVDLLVRVDDDNVERDQEALMHRFKRNIQKHVNWYNHYFRRVRKENSSGTSYSDMCDLAAENFKVARGKTFLFLDCVPILQQLPKFDPMCEEIDEIVIDDDDDAECVVPEEEKKAAVVNLIGAPKWSSEDANQRASYDRYPYGTIGRRDIGYTTTRIKGIPTNNSTEKKRSSWNQTETELE